MDTPRAPKYIAYGYPPSLTKCTNPGTSLLLQSNRISLRSKWTFVNCWKAPLSHLLTHLSQTPTPNLSYPLKTSRIGYYNNPSQRNPSQTNPSPISSSKHHRAYAPHHHTCQEALPMIHLKHFVEEIGQERYPSDMASVPMKQPLSFLTNQLLIGKQPPAMMLTYGKLPWMMGFKV